MESVVLASLGEFLVVVVVLRDIVVISEGVSLSVVVVMLVMLGTISEGFWFIVRGWVLFKLGFTDSCLLVVLFKLGFPDSCLLVVVTAWIVLGFLVNFNSLVIMLVLRGWICGRVMLGDVVRGWA